MSSNERLGMWLAMIAVAIIASVSLFLSPSEVAPIAGASGSRFPHGVSGDTTSPIDGQVRGTTAMITGTGAFATSTPSAMGDVVISSSGTTTLMLGSTSGTKGTCLQMLNSAGALTRVYILGTTLVTEAGSCK